MADNPFSDFTIVCIDGKLKTAKYCAYQYEYFKSMLDFNRDVDSATLPFKLKHVSLCYKPTTKLDLGVTSLAEMVEIYITADYLGERPVLRASIAKKLGMMLTSSKEVTLAPECLQRDIGKHIDSQDRYLKLFDTLQYYCGTVVRNNTFDAWCTRMTSTRGCDYVSGEIYTYVIARIPSIDWNDLQRFVRFLTPSDIARTIELILPWMRVHIVERQRDAFTEAALSTDLAVTSCVSVSGADACAN